MCCLVNNLGRVRLANLDKLDLKSGFCNKTRNPKTDFIFEKSYCKNCSREQWSANYVCGFPQKMERKKTQYGFRVLLQIWNEIRILKTKSKFSGLIDTTFLPRSLMKRHCFFPQWDPNMADYQQNLETTSQCLPSDTPPIAEISTKSTPFYTNQGIKDLTVCTRIARPPAVWAHYSVLWWAPLTVFTLILAKEVLDHLPICRTL